LGLAQLQGIALHVPKILHLAAAGFQAAGNVQVESLRSEARLVPPRSDFEDSWWVEKDGDLFIPQSVSVILYNTFSYLVLTFISSMRTIAVFVSKS
jgi:hypothetical protein